VKLELARQIIRGALAEGRKLNLAPLGVSVLDAGGNLVCFEREDGAGLVRFDITFAKAWGSLGMGFSSRELAKRAQQNPAFIGALATLSGGRMAPSPGGIIVVDANGAIVGAVGVSGDLGDKDELCAIAGIKSAGLTPMADA
jgi:uncharacterized protein GlcG (DUF336 family)